MPKICKTMRGFQIWPQNSNQLRFEPFFFWPKTVGNWQNTQFSPFWQLFWPEKGSNLIRFQFWGQIWSPLIILHILGTDLIWFSHFDALTSNAFSKNKLIKFATPISAWNRFFVHHWTQHVWNHGKPLDLLSISKVGDFWTNLIPSYQ